MYLWNDSGRKTDVVQFVKFMSYYFEYLVQDWTKIHLDTMSYKNKSEFPASSKLLFFYV